MELSRSGGNELVQRLSEARVLDATVRQLCKDLGTDQITAPNVGPAAFEALRTQVLPILEEFHSLSVHALQVALYRVDVPEGAAREAMDLGGLNELAGRVVLRCLQKVIVRLSFRPQ